MVRLLRYIHQHVSRYAPVDVPCRQTIIRRNRVELFLTVTLKDHQFLSIDQFFWHSAAWNDDHAVGGKLP